MAFLKGLLIVLLCHAKCCCEAQRQRMMIEDALPKCNYILSSETGSSVHHNKSWSISNSAEDFLLNLGDRPVARFECQCSSSMGNQYKGTLSRIMADSFSAIPLLHMPTTNLTIYMELAHCYKLKLALDFADMFLQRPAQSAQFGIVLKISDSRKVQITKGKLLSNQTHVVAFQNVDGKVSITGKIDSASTIRGPEKSPSTKYTTTQANSNMLMAFFINSVASFEMEGVQINVPLRITGRSLDNLQISASNFTSIPWPGFYIYNASKVSIRGNAFTFVAPRSLVFKSGLDLEVSHNLLDVASALDVSQYSRLTIYCNQKSQQQNQPKCPQESSNQSQSFRLLLGLIACLVSLMAHFWWLTLSMAILLLALYKFFLGVNEPDDPLPLKINGIHQEATKSFQAQIKPQPEMATKNLCCFSVSNSSRPNEAEKGSEDEYSNSSRLHLAGDHFSTYQASSDLYSNLDQLPSFPAETQSQYSSASSPYIRQLDRLSLTSSGPTPIGFDLWRRNPNGIAHIDSDDNIDTHSKFEEMVSPLAISPSQYSAVVSSAPNGQYYNHHQRRPVWQYPVEIPD